jgi:hypothetical protein
MSLFDGYFDPDQFEAAGGLLGRLMSLQQQQGQYQPAPGFDGRDDRSAGGGAAIVPAKAVAQAVADRPTSFLGIGDYQMPQFGGAATPQTAQPTLSLGDRLSAGFQSWVHTPVGNPFAGLANGIAGFSAGQPAAANSPVPSQATQSPDLGGHLSTAFQSWAHTPLGDPFAALANGITGFESGRRTDQASTRRDSRDAQQSQPPDIQKAPPAPTRSQMANGYAPRGLRRPVMPRAKTRRLSYGG